MEWIVCLSNAHFMNSWLTSCVSTLPYIFISSISLQAFVCRNLSTDMDLTIYNQMITIQQSPAFAQYFQPAQPAM
jgi:hypothetical protein